MGHPALGFDKQLGVIGERTFVLNAEAAEEVNKLASEAGLPPSSIIGVALRIFSLASEAKRKNRKVLITSRSGYPIEEICIPHR
jgi:hypothetical protein